VSSATLRYCHSWSQSVTTGGRDGVGNKYEAKRRSQGVLKNHPHGLGWLLMHRPDRPCSLAQHSVLVIKTLIFSVRRLQYTIHLPLHVTITHNNNNNSITACPGSGRLTWLDMTWLFVLRSFCRMNAAIQQSLCRSGTRSSQVQDLIFRSCFIFVLFPIMSVFSSLSTKKRK
jgi:hypothetical protein